MSRLDRSKPILVTLAAGTQGGAVVRAALRHGLRVRALVRSRERWQSGLAPGLNLAEGDLDDPVSLRRASAGIGGAVIQVPTDAAERMVVQARNAFSAVKDAGAASIVLKLASASRSHCCPEPSFVANAMVENAARQSDLSFTVVRPTLYLDNLLKPSARMEIARDGIFSPPIDASLRIAWTSADDCAEAAVILLKNGASSGDYRIAGPESVTGPELAARIGRGLERAIIYRAQPIATFEHEVDAAMGAGMGARVASKFRFFATHTAEAEAILGRPFEQQPGLERFRPIGITEWVQRHRERFGAGGEGAG